LYWIVLISFCCNFNNRYNPTIQGQTVKPRVLSLRGAQRRNNLHLAIATLTLAMTKVILWFNNGKDGLRVSCRFNLGISPSIYSLPTDTKCHPETRSVDGAKRHQRSEGSREILRFAQNDKLCTNLYGGKICVRQNI